MAWFHAVVTNHVVVFVLTLLGVLRELSLFFCGIVVYPAVRSSVILVGLLQFSPPLIFAVLVSLALRIKGFSASCSAANNGEAAYTAPSFRAPALPHLPADDPLYTLSVAELGAFCQRVGIALTREDRKADIVAKVDAWCCEVVRRGLWSGYGSVGRWVTRCLYVWVLGCLGSEEFCQDYVLFLKNGREILCGQRRDTCRAGRCNAQPTRLTAGLVLRMSRVKLEHRLPVGPPTVRRLRWGHCCK
ncbi:hypothetical protein FPV67DRAFT_1460885 [Lyophyllum atratum]|nr:hypothetical protein FPV67DRAFT_1460885 [Lyophyllum atratum]